MATLKSRPIQGKTLFFPTSPRTPFKIIPEISLLDQNFRGKIWDSNTQTEFYNLLKENDFFQGGTTRHPALAARDRINRTPKALGFVKLPVIGLSEAGNMFLNTDDKETVLLRQLLKYQIPSPYHPLGKNAAGYCVKPYLELLRLIMDMDGLSFDELVIFGMQLIDYRKYNRITTKIRRFRQDKDQAKSFRTSYRQFKDKVFHRELARLYRSEIKAGNFKTRESLTDSAESFIAKKAQNLRDYADAAVRNLRSSGLVSVSAVGRSLRILPEKGEEVRYLLTTIQRKPVYVDDLNGYERYLWNPAVPSLLTDNKTLVISKLREEFGLTVTRDTHVDELNKLLSLKISERRERRIAQTVSDLKSFELYESIEKTFDELSRSYDPPLFLEWNVWRGMTMLNGGTIRANLKFDDYGDPMSTALGNTADIVCDYGDFDVIVEVTMAKGALQWKMEGEPIPRHIGIHKKQTRKPTYCFFIAPSLNPATIAHFFTLYITNVEMYGGKCCIIPLSLDTFRIMLKKAVEAPSKPKPADILRLFDTARGYAQECVAKGHTETDWFAEVTGVASRWLG